MSSESKKRKLEEVEDCDLEETEGTNRFKKACSGSPNGDETFGKTIMVTSSQTFDFNEFMDWMKEHDKLSHLDFQKKWALEVSGPKKSSGDKLEGKFGYVMSGIKETPNTVATLNGGLVAGDSGSVDKFIPSLKRLDEKWTKAFQDQKKLHDKKLEVLQKSWSKAFQEQKKLHDKKLEVLQKAWDDKFQNIEKLLVIRESLLRGLVDKNSEELLKVKDLLEAKSLELLQHQQITIKLEENSAELVKVKDLVYKTEMESKATQAQLLEINSYQKQSDENLRALKVHNDEIVKQLEAKSLELLQHQQIPIKSEEIEVQENPECTSIIEALKEKCEYLASEIGDGVTALRILVDTNSKELVKVKDLVYKTELESQAAQAELVEINAKLKQSHESFLELKAQNEEIGKQLEAKSLELLQHQQIPIKLEEIEVQENQACTSTIEAQRPQCRQYTPVELDFQCELELGEKLDEPIPFELDVQDQDEVELEEKLEISILFDLDFQHGLELGQELEIPMSFECEYYLELEEFDALQNPKPKQPDRDTLKLKVEKTEIEDLGTKTEKLTILKSKLGLNEAQAQKLRAKIETLKYQLGLKHPKILELEIKLVESELFKSAIESQLETLENSDMD